MDTQTTAELTFGEKLVGKTFNPSKNPKVDRVKELCAELADITMEEKYDCKEYLRNCLINHTIGQILNAQMNVVKLITLPPPEF